MHNKLSKLLEAEEKANRLFAEISARGLIQSGLTEKELNARVYELAFELFGIKKYWHKRIVRAGKNTLLPYKHNPQHLTLQQDDILFLDFGPVFEDWEADFGRTFVIGKDAHKLKLQSDIELAWHDGQAYYLQNKAFITGAGLYAFSQALAKKYGWEFGNTHCGHLIGNFPHEKIQGEEIINYIHPENTLSMSAPDKLGQQRFWIYEIHFVDKARQIGGFFEQMIASN